MEEHHSYLQILRICMILAQDLICMIWKKVEERALPTFKEREIILGVIQGPSYLHTILHN